MVTPISYCFCSLATGQRYRAHAKQLAQDLQKHAPETVLLLLTDKPKEFDPFPNVQAVPHRLQSVKGYYDKRFVIRQAFSQFEACIFVDSDIRVLGPIPETLELTPGLMARYGCGIIKHNTQLKIRPAFPLIQETAQALNVDLEETVWFHEFMFSLRKQQGKEEAFLEAFEHIGERFERAGTYDGVGNVMGLAAAASGLTVTFHREDWFPCFKDNIQKEKIKSGEADPNVMKAEFAQHREIEYPQRTLPQRIKHRLMSEAGFFYRLAKLRLRTLKQ